MESDGIMEKRSIWQAIKGIRIPKTLKNILFVLLGMIVAVIIGYFIFTGQQV